MRVTSCRTPFRQAGGSLRRAGRVRPSRWRGPAPRPPPIRLAHRARRTRRASCCSACSAHCVACLGSRLPARTPDRRFRRASTACISPRRRPSRGGDRAVILVLCRLRSPGSAWVPAVGRQAAHQQVQRPAPGVALVTHEALRDRQRMRARPRRRRARSRPAAAAMLAKPCSVR